MNWPERDPVVIRRLSVGGLVLAVLLLFLMINSYLQSKPENEKPVLGLMSSLPLRWSEGGIRAEIDGTATPAPAYDRLAKDFRIQLIDDIADLKRRKITLLLLAQPRGLSPSALFDLDQWVRSGGHVFVLADPALQWESDFPIGDTRRPLFTSLLSPLLSHWGVELVMPMEGREALTVRTLDGIRIRTTTPGAWQVRAGKSDPTCQISEDFLRANCSLGRGKAVLFADADILDARHWEATGVRRLGGSDDFANMDWLKQELVKLQSVSK
jgi:ABC-type uncharacterized transport system